MDRERAGRHKGRALQLLAQARAQLKSGTYQPGTKRRPKTLDALEALRFEHEKQRRPDSEYVPKAHNQFKKYISPRLGKRNPDSIQAHEISSVLWDAYEQDEGKRRQLDKVGAKTVENIFGTVSAVYRFGVFRQLCDNNPCRDIESDVLPHVGKQKRPCFSDHEAIALIAYEDPEQAQYRILYALLGFAGLRLGEGLGRRWRDIDWDAPELPSMHVWSQYQDRHLKTAKDDDPKERMVPLHPELARILREWWRTGWAKRYGRLPRLDDFIVPSPSTMKAYTKAAGDQLREKYAPLLGIPNKGNHALRRYFITYAQKGGPRGKARPDMLEKVTHNAKGTMIDVYTDVDALWPALCEAVLCLNVQWPNEKNVVDLRTKPRTMQGGQ